MNSVRKEVIDFLHSKSMDFKSIDMERSAEDFLDEMERGLSGAPSSLQMIPTHIGVESDIPLNTPVIVLDAGGTNFRVATMYFDEASKPVIQNYKRYPMPGIEAEVSKEEFFKVIAAYMKDVLDSSSQIGFCFSYPAEITPDKDGRLLQFSKEIKAKEVIGQLIGENLRVAIRTMGYRPPKHVVILNDTVATLLAGRSAFTNRKFDTYIGFILGTGTNTCYIERNSNITKNMDLDPGKSQIINVESGNFAKAPRGVLDHSFDSSMINPGQYTFEKMISGAYFGSLCLTTIQEAAKEKCFISSEVAKELERISSLDTKNVHDFMVNPWDRSNPLAAATGSGNAKDCMILYHIIDRLIERAAKLTAVNLSSVAIKSEKGKNPFRPVCITAEGSTFYGLKTLKERVECYLMSYLNDKRESYYEIVNVENATLIGAAIAGLTN